MSNVFDRYDPSMGGGAARSGSGYRVTTYSPQRGGDRMEGGYESSRPGPDGINMVRTLEDYRSGASPYVTVAGNPALYGRQYLMPEVAYNVGGQRYVLNNVPVVVHDTGSAFRNAPEGRFDVPVSRDLGPADTNQGLSGVQFVPTQMAFAGNTNAQPAPGIQAINAATARGANGAAPVANIFDQFDTPAPSSGAPAGSVNIFDQFDEPAAAKSPSGRPTFDMGMPVARDAAPAQTDQAPRSGIWNNLTAGLNDALYTVAGAPVDAARWVLNQAGAQARAISGAPVQEIQPGPGGSDWIARQFQNVGVNNPANVTPANTAEKIARAAGEGVGYAVAPEAVIAGLGRAGVLTDAAVQATAPYIGRSASAGDFAANAAVGGAAGAGAQVAGDAVPEQYRPLAEFGGGLAAGGVAAAATALPAVVRAGVRAGEEYFSPLSAAGRERMAADTIKRDATNPYAVREALDAGTREIVPGSAPTTGQMTGDMGLLSLERGVATRNPAEFNARRAEQNAARTTALGGLQPETGPEAVVAALRKNLADIDARTTAAQEEAANGARTATAAMGGRGTPEGYGATIRQGISEAETAAREQERALWNAIDPDNSLVLNVDETRKLAREIPKQMPKTAKPLEGEERQIFIAAARMPSVAPFNELTALRSRVSTAMKKELRENGQSPVYARLSQLRASIQSDIEGAVSAKAAQEADAVASGAMREEDTMLAKWEAAFSASVERWRDHKAGSLGESSVASAGASGPSREAALPPAYGSKSSGRGGFYDAASNQGVQGLTPNFDEAAAARLNTATDATRTRAQTYNTGPVRQVMRRDGAQGPYAVPASTVPGKFFRPGPRGYEDAEALRKATSPEIMLEVRDYALSTLRKAAERPDGTLDPAKVETWKRQHADALRAIPEISFLVDTPVRASEAMELAAVQRKQALEAFQDGAVARLLKIDDPADISRTIGGLFSRQDAARQMALLRRQIGNDTEAKEGLKRGVVDHIMSRFISNMEAATTEQGVIRSDQFQTFVRQNVPALRQAGFSEKEINTLRAVANDLQRSNRSLVAARIPGQSNTAQDTIAAGRDGASLLSRIISAIGPATASGAAGLTFGGPVTGLIGIVGGGAVSAMRKAGLEKVDDIIKDALLNPDRARLLLERFPPKPTRREQFRIMERYRRAVPAAVGAGEDR